jgi:hypothetical protein
MSNQSGRKQGEKGPLSFENWKAEQAGVPVYRAYEYPLYTDAHVIGDDLAEEYGPYLLMNACPNPWLKQARPTLVLYSEQHFKYEPEVKLETDDESYHGGYLQDEIAALVSLCLGIRLKAGEPNRMFGADDKTGRPISYGYAEDPTPPNLPRSLVLPSATGDHYLESASLLTSLPRLSPKSAVALIRAARLYQEAVWIVESTPELSWIMLTSAVETAASHWRSTNEEPLDRLNTSRPKLVGVLKEYGGDELALKVAEELAPVMGATKKFIDFILEFLPDPPAERSYKWAQHPWDEKAMKASLRVIYMYRSRALHGGTPFPAPMCLPPDSVAEKKALVEVPMGLSMTSRGGTWASKDTPMLLHVFEYIVRNSLIKWWRTLEDEDSVAAVD